MKDYFKNPWNAFDFVIIPLSVGRIVNHVEEAELTLKEIKLMEVQKELSKMKKLGKEKSG